MIKLSLMLLFFCSCLGCASFADREYACRENNKKLGYGYANSIAGNIFQYGDCAAFPGLRIEAGQYYSLHKEDIIWAVSTDKGIKDAGASELNDFARALKCDKSANLEFTKMLIKNKEAIFGKDYDNYAHQVTRTIIALIKRDPSLSGKCGV
ncbi:hypothetical protein [Bdellovibrio sp. HCB-162]|uniref:hypothetical protein n=1 Tax=Bdellovibrio sp. HCB-162 TaxID=3394234 RepID=UPI0039BD412D